MPWRDGMDGKTMRILLVEDDRGLGAAVREQAASGGHAVDWALTIADAGDFLRTVAYDLVLLDLMLPDGRGLDLLADLRRGGSVVPVIILTARDMISERIAGLNAGADDYLVKPFDLAELAARIAAVARRYAGNPNPFTRIAGNDIDVASRRIQRDGRSVDLTAREWSLLETLLQRPGMICPKSLIEERLFDLDSDFESNAIEVYVSRLRKKLGSGIVETVRGVGYRLGQ